MVYTLGEAAKATGKSKATISKAIKNGRISAIKDDTGTFNIDPSELHRVYPLIVASKHEEVEVNTTDVAEYNAIVRELKIRLEVATERLADKEAMISDLRDERDRWRQQATLLLTDQRPKASLWKRIFGKD